MKTEKQESTEEKFISNQEKYKQELERLELKYNGMLNPKDIVREASKNSSPLHNWFDWSDDEAGEKWRLHQARHLINQIKVTVMFEGNKKSYRKYLSVNVDTNGKNDRRYIATETISLNKNMKEQILRRALQEIAYWERTYRDYQELEDIFKGITKTKKKLKKKILVSPIAE